MEITKNKSNITANFNSIPHFASFSRTVGWKFYSLTPTCGNSYE